MTRYAYPVPKSPNYRKPEGVEECLEQARLLIKKEHGRAAMGPVKKGDQVLIVTLPDQDACVKGALTEAFKEAGAEKVDFILSSEFTGEDPQVTTVEEGWREVEILKQGRAPGAYAAKKNARGIDGVNVLRQYLDGHPEYTTLFWELGGRRHKATALREHGHKLRGNWLFNNWEEFLSKAWVYPDELWREIERKIIEPLGEASAVRITDPEGTYLEYNLTRDEAKRWQMTAFLPGHLLMDPLQATAEEAAVTTHINPTIPPVFPRHCGVLAGTANHVGFFPRIELHFDQGRLVDVKGGGKYGEGIRELAEKYRDIRYPAYPDKGFFWFCDCALCTVVKAFRRTSDMFRSLWWLPNTPERNRGGVFHMGMGSRWHREEHRQYAFERNLPTGHIHVHNYFATFEIKLRDSAYWYKIVDKGRPAAMDDPEIRALAVKFGDPEELLAFDWVPPLPGINCEGNYRQDYAPDPAAYLKKRRGENQSI